MVVWHQVALAAMWGGLLALERRAYLQAMVSRPLVAATGMGLLMSDVSSGLTVGIVLELYFLGSASLGAAIPEHDTLAATGTAAAAAALSHSSGGGSTPAIWSVSILLFVGLGGFGRRLDRSLERYSTRLEHRALDQAAAGDLDRAIRQNLWGMWPHFVVFGFATAVCAVIGFWLGPVFDRIPLRVVRGLAWAYPAMASVAAAIAAKGSHARRAAFYALAAGAVVLGGALVTVLLRGHL